MTAAKQLDPTTPRERPILFSGAMVRAILDGRKTQTRRIVARLPRARDDMEQAAIGPCPYGGWSWQDARGNCHSCDGAVQCPYGAPGERLYVREHWRTLAEYDHLSGTELGQRAIGAGYRAPWAPLRYEADGTRVEWPSGDLAHQQPGRLRQALFMPRWASRITLEITGVRVERLHDISEADAQAAGVVPFPRDPEGDCWSDGRYLTALEYAWNERHGWDPNAWRANPWVWVVEFRRVSP